MIVWGGGVTKGKLGICPSVALGVVIFENCVWSNISMKNTMLEYLCIIYVISMLYLCNI